MTYSPSEIRNLRTLCVGQCCDLKIERRTERVWLCRAGGGVSVERKTRDGKWYVSEGGCAPALQAAR